MPFAHSGLVGTVGDVQGQRRVVGAQTLQRGDTDCSTSNSLWDHSSAISVSLLPPCKGGTIGMPPRLFGSAPGPR